MQSQWRLVDGWVDLERGQVERGAPVTLTPREVQLLRYLASRPPKPCPIEELLRNVWGYNARVQSRAVVSLVHRLRGKLEVDPKNPSHLVTVYGKGVYFRPAEPEVRPVVADFMGRDDVLEQVLAALDGGRSVMVTGTGGVGKTRLAREVLAQREGVFCSLAMAGDLEEATRALAWTLGVDLSPADPQEALSDLAEAMAARGILVLDNAEQIEGLAPWVEALGPDVRGLITSRRWEESDLEHVALRPLDIDAGVALLRSLTGLAASPELEAVVRGVQGLPLALHLVHPHFSWLAPAEVAEQARLLVDDAQGEGHHGSLGAVVRGSLDLLPPEARAGLMRLGALPHAPWPVEAASAVVGSREGLKQLVDASLLERRPGSGQPLEMHPLVHRQLDPSATDAREASDRLQQWFVRWIQPLLLEQAPEQADMLIVLAPLLAGLVAPGPEVHFGCALAAYERGDLAFALGQVQAGRAAAGGGALVRARLRVLQCQVERRLGRGEAAASALAEALAGDWEGPAGVGSAGWHVVGGCWSTLGQHGRALDAYERAGAGADERSAVERALLRLDRCKSEAALGQLAEAYANAQEAWSDLEGGPNSYVINGLNTLGTLALRLGRHGTARGWFEQALALGRADPLRTAVVHSNLAAVELSRGNADAALAHAENALQAHRRMGRRRGMVLARIVRGRALLLAHRWAEAVPELDLAGAQAERMGMVDQSRWARGFLAIALAEQGDSDEAAEQLRLAALQDDVGVLATAHLARSRGERVSLAEAGMSPELWVHVRAFIATAV